MPDVAGETLKRERGDQQHGKEKEKESSEEEIVYAPRCRDYSR
jgi:hypothetical protein